MGLAKRIYLVFCYRYAGLLLCLGCGAMIFKHVEFHEIKSKPPMTENAKGILITELERLQKSLSKLLNTTIDQDLFDNVTKEVNRQEPKLLSKPWRWAEGLHFAFTIMTTIGYGDIVPKTDLGKSLCILYGVVSIPLYLLALSAAGDMKGFHIEKLLTFFEKRLLKRETIHRKHAKTVGITIVLFFVEALIATSATHILEGWSFFHSFYFWFISTSTIGFGDYVMDRKNTVWTFLFFVFFTLVLQSGLATIFDMAVEASRRKATSISSE